MAGRWEPDCRDTLAAWTTGRPDWATIKRFYDWIDATTTRDGPTSLPLEVTQIEVTAPVAPSEVLVAPFLSLYRLGAWYQPGSGARAFLFRRDQRAVDLGEPVSGHIEARGAEVGDRLCVYELAAARLGCVTIENGDEQIDIVDVPGWKPELIIKPVTSNTVDITVTGVEAGHILRRRLFAGEGAVTTAQTLVGAVEDGKRTYRTRFTFQEPAKEGYVQVWVRTASDLEAACDEEQPLDIDLQAQNGESGARRLRASERGGLAKLGVGDACA